MYYIIIVTLFIFSALLPFGAIADELSQMSVSDEFRDDISYDFEQSRIYQVEGHSMKHLGFDEDVLVDVVPASDFNVGDIIAFECFNEACSGAYIKEIAGKQDSCFWVEGRKDIWEENGKRRQSMDSRTTYGWLCGDEIDIYGAAFKQDVKA